MMIIQVHALLYLRAKVLQKKLQNKRHRRLVRQVVLEFLPQIKTAVARKTMLLVQGIMMLTIMLLNLKVLTVIVMLFLIQYINLQSQTIIVRILMVYHYGT